MEETIKQELLRKDRSYVWHPFTQMKDYDDRDHVLIERAEGIYIYDADGRRFYDTVSSWWCNLHGHGHPRIKEAIRQQLDRFDHIMFSGLTHAPGIELAEQLVSITPAGLNKVFYSDNGSTAVEVAIKMSFQYWQQIGRASKTKFAFLDGSYHGDTLGAVSVGGVQLYHSLFKPLLFHAHRMPAPDLRQARAAGPEGEREVAETALAQVRELFEREADTLAGFIVEPMLQGAGGMIMTPAAYLQGLRELCTAYGVHLIADEVATGFGRTGKMFACEHAGVSPDIICLSKGLTAGIMPLSATLCTDDIYDAFYDDYATQKTFFHGHSFTGNPVACAVALASLRLFEEECTLERAQDTIAALAEALGDIARLPHVADARQLGLVAAFDLYEDAERRRPFPPERRIGAAMYEAGFEEGLILRPLGDTLYYWLPLCATPDDIRDIAARTKRVLRRVLG
ncbi:adenosylmethionine--8-amino-7-oxononanoate transaminase [Paenibacillus apiarius]|uniref:Adenosylmethionine-8-amino-7-oxononanoate aminotransferase n=1 Tax=Paenibacillus apiarius TaxID=46240 RepID=A0ABT4DR92_9BACL|nr:adenosylmethionine--8-amino-7-oxononanoate transaminase [Paenibacillus apiarius]MCY9515657.1 adenosylmethionine--8-amino-7-oxononanoate transaminase [Paenibacillus apiarius]MCY9519270.1 adenosylmethionine--8-amino-7-oxononanoate transaminase [Paenibacillus apiarius]MCY9550906.1 adenosylmethionine--8-amino-7-oxononanoate transaminase [Paenibacillus apiarius]MCY9559002.1 adenosylmethionine--8-amino-7-oxononanoate transaminase [Paenibacillus apiarius]MCY9683521.1 adenosylmethionine--8-amino-7-